MGMQDFKDQWDAMERLGADEQRVSHGVGFGDIEFVRLLPPGQFQAFLEHHGVRVADFGRSPAKTVRDLWAEVMMRESELEQYPNPSKPCGFELRRRVRQVVLDLSAEVGEELKYLLLKELLVQSGRRCKNLAARVSLKMFPDESVADATQRCMLQVLGVPEETSKRHFVIESTEDSQEVKFSTGFPGMLTLYVLTTIRVRVPNSTAHGLGCIGLPKGREFSVSCPQSMVAGRTRRFMWVSESDFEEAKIATGGYKVPTLAESSNLTKPHVVGEDS
jgi:hypothetical protein